MELLKRYLSPLVRRDNSYPRFRVRVSFTGLPAANGAEDLIERIARGQQSIALNRLQEQLVEALYQSELRQGAWTLDIGIWGPAVFRKEARRIMESVRPEFALLVREGETQEAPREIDATSRRIASAT